MEKMNSCKNMSTLDNHTNYWNSVDLLKGVLIILVFLGHMIPGKLNDTFARYIIYSFHMPLFIGISGFLINVKKYDFRILMILRKYLRRLLIPWLIAVLVYFLVVKKNNYSVRLFMVDVYRPYYHLWYVLGLISYIILFGIMWRYISLKQYKWLFILALSFLISIFSKWNIIEGMFQDNYVNYIIGIFKHDFRLFNLIFFVIGTYCRNLYEKQFVFNRKLNVFMIIVTVLMVLVTIGMFKMDNIEMKNIMYYALNIPLLILVLQCLVHLNVPKVKVLEFMGRYSLPFYLYHVLCRFLAKNIYSVGTLKYYIITVLAFILLYVLIYEMRKIKVLDRYFFGTMSSKA